METTFKLDGLLVNGLLVLDDDQLCEDWKSCFRPADGYIIRCEPYGEPCDVSAIVDIGDASYIMFANDEDGIAVVDWSGWNFEVYKRFHL